jgi:hypothetical protein
MTVIVRAAEPIDGKVDGNMAGRQALYESIGAEFETGINLYRLKDVALQTLAAA